MWALKHVRVLKLDVKLGAATLWCGLQHEAPDAATGGEQELSGTRQGKGREASGERRRELAVESENV